MPAEAYQLRESLTLPTDIGERLDAERGVLKGIKVLGLVSQNGRKYTPGAVKDALPLIEGARVFIDHSPEDENGDPLPRKVGERFGRLREARVDATGEAWADLHYNPHHKEAQSFLWHVRNDPAQIGCSIIGNGTGKRLADGTKLVERITKIVSVDIVDGPATVFGLFEQSKPDAKAPLKLRENFTGETKGSDGHTYYYVNGVRVGKAHQAANAVSEHAHAVNTPEAHRLAAKVHKEAAAHHKARAEKDVDAPSSFASGGFQDDGEADTAGPSKKPDDKERARKLWSHPGTMKAGEHEYHAEMHEEEAAELEKKHPVKEQAMADAALKPAEDPAAPQTPGGDAGGDDFRSKLADLAQHVVSDEGMSKDQVLTKLRQICAMLEEETGGESGEDGEKPSEPEGEEEEVEAVEQLRAFAHPTVKWAAKRLGDSLREQKKAQLREQAKTAGVPEKAITDTFVDTLLRESADGRVKLIEDRKAVAASGPQYRPRIDPVDADGKRKTAADIAAELFAGVGEDD